MAYKFNPTRPRPWSESGVHQYLQGSKVRTSAGYVSKGGYTLAIPCAKKRGPSAPSSARNTRDSPASTDVKRAAAAGRRARTAPSMPASNWIGRTEYADQFREQVYSFCSMDRKPLQPYNPLAQRSRLAIDDPRIPIKNASVVPFGVDPLHSDKRRFETTHQNFFKGEPCDPRSNQAILGASLKFTRHLRGQ
mmetsp:Transcript_119901/g.208179  ORF Transcript_119901/g.208179 Transcript_119901/m.208179 type:complete len:192 (-) Transcript_119901:64-639(-)